MKIYGGVEIAPHILNLGTRCEWSASCPACFTPGKETPSIYWIGGWVGLRAGLDTSEEKISALAR